MTAFQFFLSGANLPFVFALGVSVCFVLLSWSGVLGLLAGGGDAEVEGDGDADVDADASGDGDADGDDADGEDAEEAEEAQATPVLRLPLTVRGPIAAIGFGLTGLALNAASHGEAAALPLFTLAWTLPFGALAGHAASRVVARVLAPLLDDRRNAAPDRKSLVGKVGTVISTSVSPDFGEIRLRDESGHHLRMIVKLASGEKQARAGDEVVVVDLDERGTPRVALMALPALPPG